MEITPGNYKTRSGEIAIIREIDMQNNHGLFYSGCIGKELHGWYENGRWYPGVNSTHDFDLIERMPDEAPIILEKTTPPAFGTHKYKPNRLVAILSEDKARRDAIALKAMESILLRGDVVDVEQVALLAYGVADHMLLVREQ